MNTKLKIILIMTLFTCVQANSQTQSPPCTGEQYRFFDFWVGDWKVTANGKLAGYNSIALAHNKCVLTENYSTPSGYTGQSVNGYNAVSGKWHQTWMDSTGAVLLLDGGIVDGNMVLEGEGVAPTGQPIVNRITWTPNKDGSVRQHWQARAVDGAAWQTVFDGLYTKRQQP